MKTAAHWPRRAAAWCGRLPAWIARQPLRVRLAGVTSVVLVLGIGLVGISAVLKTHAFLMTQTDNQLTQNATRFQNMMVSSSNLMADIPTVTSGSSLSQYVVLAYAPSGNYLGIDGSPSVLASDGSIPKLPKLTSNDVNAKKGHPYTIPGTTSAVPSWRAVAFFIPDPSTKAQLPAIIAIPLNPIDQVTRQLVLILLLAAAGVIILGGLGGYLLVQRSLKPLVDIEQAAKKAADGDLTQRAPLTSNTATETGHLTRSFNWMLDQIETSFEAQQQSERRMREFVGDASHELRTPLAAIRGYGELYRIGAITSDEGVADAMRRIESEATRMGSLAESLLTLTRLDDAQGLELRPVNMAGVALDAIGDLGAIDPSRKCEVLGIDSPGNFAVIGDENRLHQVLTNLIGNIVRYTPEGSPVEIAITPSPTPDQGDVIVEVRDHGPGIPPEHAAHVFERFYRIDKSRSRESGGSGLGLAIVASIIRAHHGEITVIPTPGGGATFRISLPALTRGNTGELPNVGPLL